MLNPKLRQRITDHDNEIDWQRVGDLARSPRGLPVPVTGPAPGLEGVLAQARLVENSLPTGSNWDGKSGLLVDEKTFHELLGDRNKPAANPPSPVASQ
jgi:hypothetical protein